MARRLLLATVAAFLAAATASEAALTTEKCVAQKRKAWTTFRQCEGAADAKRLLGKPTDLGRSTACASSTTRIA
jgi:hypothetical protein